MPTYHRDELKATLKVGMEIHVELATHSKMWTSAPNVAHPANFDAEPNSLLDPVVVGMPGTLPVMNEQAVEMSMLVGMALNCTIPDYTKWDRKSYWYPDLPKNYQLSQYDQPLCEEGYLEVPVPQQDGSVASRRIGIIRAHLEEDAGKLAHEAPGGIPIDHSIVDLNRAGTPLLEIVTEPDITSPAEAVAFGAALRDICRHLGVSEGIMQKGHMRFEPNINVVIETPDGQTFKTPIVEIKNLNSFRAVHDAIAYEYHRQVEDWIETGKVMGARAKSTRGWDDVKGVTTLQREKEDADEYRYFPDPDLVAVTIDDAWRERVRAQMPELPLAKRERYLAEGLTDKQADQLITEPATCRFYDDVVALGTKPDRAASVLLNAGAKRANEQQCRLDELGISPEQVHQIVALADADKIGSSAADQLFGLCCESDDPAERLAEANGLLQVSDTGALEGFIDQILADAKNAKAVADLEAGKDKAIGALIGQLMKLSKGQANPKVARELIIKKVRG